MRGDHGAEGSTSEQRKMFKYDAETPLAYLYLDVTLFIHLCDPDVIELPTFQENALIGLHKSIISVKWSIQYKVCIVLFWLYYLICVWVKCDCFLYFMQLWNYNSTPMVQLCTANGEQSQYGHRTSLCILQGSVKTPCQLPPTFRTMLCTIDKPKALAPTRWR